METEGLPDNYTDFYDLSPVGYFTLDKNGLITETNLTGASLLGVAKRYLIKKPLSHFITKEDQDQFYLYCRQVSETKIRQTCELKLMKKDGTPFFAQLEGISIPDAKATPENHFWVAILDITERKQIEAEQERLRAAQWEQRLWPEILEKVLSSLATHPSHQVILEDILYQLQRIIPYSAANVMSLEKGILRVVYWQGYEPFGSEEFISTLEQPLANFPLDTKVVQLQQPLVIPDTHLEPDWIATDESRWIRSFIAVPLCVHEQVLGLLRLDSELPNNFSPRDVERVQHLSNAAAICLKNAQPHDQTRQELTKRVVQAETEIIQLNQRLLALQYSSATITSNLSLQHILDTVAEEIANLLKVAGCAIFEWDRVTNTISAMTKYGLNRRWEEGLLVETFSVADFLLIQRVLVERRPQQITINHPGMYPAELAYMQKAKLRTLLMVPMEFQDRVIGLVKLMDVARWERTFTNREIGLAQLLVNQVASAIENIRLYEQLQEQLTEQAQIEKDLRRVAARQQAILNAIPDSLLYFDRNGKLLEYKTVGNYTLFEILDKTLVSENMTDGSSTNLIDLIRHNIDKSFDSDKMQSFQYRLLLPEDPQDFEVRIVTSGPNEALAIVRNITEYKRMEE